MPIGYHALTKGLLKHEELDIAGGFPAMVQGAVALELVPSSFFSNTPIIGPGIFADQLEALLRTFH